MEYEVLDTADAPMTDLSEIEEIPLDLSIRAIDDILGTEEIKVTLSCEYRADQVA